jgi:hypothetical protein
MLQLTASADGIESERSSPLSVTVASLALTGTTTAPRETKDAPSDAGIMCLDAASRDCYDGRRLASVPGHVSALLTAGDRIFLVERDARIRVIANDALEPAPALTLDEGTRITGLAIPPDFERSHAVFVAWSEPSVRSGEILNVTRYRELLGTLGEGVTIVTGLPLPPGAAAPIAMDDGGLLYAALPSASAPPGAPDSGASNGVLMRLAPDGSVPGTNPRSSPLVAYGYARPSSLTFDAMAGGLWLSGADPRWPSPVSTLSVDVDERRDWPWVPSPADLRTPADVSPDGPLLSITTGTGPIRSRNVWLIAAPGVVEGAIVVQGRILVRFDPLGLDRIGRVVAVVQGPGQDLLVVTRATSSDSDSTIWRFVRRSPAQ